MKKKNKKSLSFQGLSAKTLEDITMTSDGGVQTATASGYAKRIKMTKGKEKKQVKLWKDPVFVGAIIGACATIIAALITVYNSSPHK